MMKLREMYQKREELVSESIRKSSCRDCFQLSAEQERN